MNTKEHLLHEAITSFIKKGYENTSINDITTSCNITKGAFYHHFSSKEDIFLQAIQIITDEIKVWTDKKISSAKNIKELIESLFDYSDYFSFSKYYNNIDSDTYLILINFIKKFPEFKSKAAASIFGSLETIQEKMEEAQRQGSVKKEVDATYFALHICTLMEGLMFVASFTGTEAELIANGKKIAQNLWTMIKT